MFTLYLRDALLVITTEQELGTGPGLLTNLHLVTTVTTVGQTVTYLVLEIETRTGIKDQTTDLLSEEAGPVRALPLSTGTVRREEGEMGDEE